MFRTRLAAAALVTLIVLPGCGTLCGDRPRICERWCRPNNGDAFPASYPGGNMGCGTNVVPPGGMMGGPIMIGPGGYPYGGETLPSPNGMPRIPAGIIDTPGENKGKQFNPDNGASRTGPVLMIPANNSK